MERLKLYFYSLPKLLRLLIMLILLLIIIGLTARWIEPATFKSAFDGIWWAIGTAATEGYGDFTPKTFAGKCLSILLIFLGTGFMAYTLTTLAKEAFNMQQDLFHGNKSFTHEDHHIIIGWNEKSRYLINKLIELDPNARIVLLDQTLLKTPLKIVHFINGDACEDDTLMRANILKAKNLTVLSSPHKEEKESDMRNILIALAAKGLNPEIKMAIEILTPSQYDNAKRAGVNQIIFSSHLISEAFLEFVF